MSEPTETKAIIKLATALKRRASAIKRSNRHPLVIAAVSEALSECAQACVDVAAEGLKHQIATEVTKRTKESKWKIL